MPTVGIVIPAYNAAKYLSQTLTSVVAQTHGDFEVVVIDDGSTDATAEVAERVGDRRIRVISRPNAGMPASRNFGIHSCDCDFIALLDSDDLWHPRKLELQVELMRRAANFGLCFSQFTGWQGGDTADFDKSVVSNALDPRLTGWIYHQMILTNWALPSSVVFSRTLWDTQGDFLCEDQKTDDWEYLVRASCSFQVAKLRDSLVLYRQHSGSLSKRVAAENKGELMRARLLSAYGMTSPQGISVDTVELTRRRYMGRRHFADSHLAGGNLGLGLRQVWNLLLSGPYRLQTAEMGVRAVGKRVLSALRS